jgi:hypothetical protein
MAQAVSRRLLTAATRFDPRSSNVEFVVDKVALEQDFLRALRFPLPVFIATDALYLLTYH